MATQTIRRSLKYRKRTPVSGDFFTTNTARPELFGAWSFKDDTEVQSQIDSPTQTKILSSTAATPTVVTGGWAPFTISSSIDDTNLPGNAVITTSGAHGLRDDDRVNITGHSLSVVNGTWTTVKTSNTTFRIDGLDLGGSTGTGGTGHKAGHRLVDGLRVTISEHVAIPDGEYRATVIDQDRFSLATLAGVPVTGTGGGTAGVYTIKVWEVHGPSPGTGKVDDYSDPQIGCRASVSVHGGDVLDTNHCAFDEDIGADGNADKVLMVWDNYYTPEWVTAYENKGSQVKSYQMNRGSGVYLQLRIKFIGGGQGFNIVDRTIGNPGGLETEFEHQLNNGDTVRIEDDTQVPDGNYVATVTGSKTFTIPHNIVANPGTGKGTAMHVNTQGKLNTLIQAGAEHLWAIGGLTADGFRTINGFTGEGTPESDSNGCGVVRHSTWQRYWAEYKMWVPGDQFTSWGSHITNDLFFPSYVLGKRDISISVSGGVATCTSTTANLEPHAYETNCRTTIANTGNSNLDGIRLITGVSGSATSTYNSGFTGENVFTFATSAPNGSYSGTSTLLFHMFSLWVADEEHDPVRVVYKAPVKAQGGGVVQFYQEHDGAGRRVGNDYNFYVRNHFALRNFNLSEADTTIFARPTAVE